MEKEALKLIIMGHVDHGKSTLIGRLLLDTNSLPKEKIAELKQISRQLGKETELAYLTDQLKEEREKNITIDTTQIFFKTAKRNYVIIDVPGHVEFLKNMLSGATQAEAAVLIIDTAEGVKEQTSRHLYLASMLGINQVVLALNKMDMVDYQQERFLEVKEQLSEFLAKLKIKPAFIIPISARAGDNISSQSRKMGWYKGASLLTALESVKTKEQFEEKPLRFPIQDVYQQNGERIIVGRVASGQLRQEQEVILLPDFQAARISAIKVWGQDRKTSASEGESIGLILEPQALGKRGEIIVPQESPPKPSDEFKGNIFWMSEQPLKINTPITIRCATQEVTARAVKIEKRINSSTFEVMEENAGELKLNEAGIVQFKTEKAVVTEKFSLIPELGRFVVEQELNLPGAGIIVE